MLVSAKGVDRVTVRKLNAALVGWVIAWVAFGAVVGVEVWQLDRLGTSVAQNAKALGDTGGSLSSLSGLPLVGDRVGNVASEVRKAAAQTEAEALAMRGQFHSLAILFGLMVALVPTLPIVVIYVAFRRGLLAVLVADSGGQGERDGATGRWRVADIEGE